MVHIKSKFVLTLSDTAFSLHHKQWLSYW